MTARMQLVPRHPKLAPVVPLSAREADAELVEGVRAGDADAGTLLFDRHHDHVRRVLNHVIGPRAALDDLVQDVFIEALRPWLGSIAAITARAWLRRRARRKWQLLVPPADPDDESQDGRVDVPRPLSGARAIPRGSGKATHATPGLEGMICSYPGAECECEDDGWETLPPKRRDELLGILKIRFEKNARRHPGIRWEAVRARLEGSAEKLWSLNEMEASGGEPDVVAHDAGTGEYGFHDCSAQSPKGRRSVCFDLAALASRKEHKPTQPGAFGVS